VQLLMMLIPSKAAHSVSSVLLMIDWCLAINICILIG